ncbi:MAG: PBP1A family penicillin-binding protein [Desulfuromonadaceae bacterium]|nr:PBP1A family penicillin-binding protein [Desulfuromonadaceae bacterium]
MFRKILRFSFLFLGGCAIVGLSALIGAYYFVAESLPRMDKLEDYRPPVITRVYSEDNQLIAEFYRERRIVVPVSKMPQKLIHAFVSAEDSGFFEHQGIDLVSIFRAALRNIQAGGIVQGGSTITQQVAKSLLLTPERKFSRKFKEAILAWRMEQHFDKREILYLYLNQIYLGHGAYGVQAAAENYFAKNVEELNLAECSMLAGLPQAPSRYSPYQHFKRAKERQHYVLQRMAANGYISPLDAEQAYAQELTIHPRGDNSAAGTGYFSEQVRRYLEENYGTETLYSGGLQVHTTMNLSMQQQAQEAVRDNLQDYDHRQGLQPISRIMDPDGIDTHLHQPTQALSVNQRIEAVITGQNKDSVLLRAGEMRGHIPLASLEWAQPFSIVDWQHYQDPGFDSSIFDHPVIPTGSIVTVDIVAIEESGFQATLFQQPQAQGALIALDPHTGFVRAMVGGYDFSTSQFNRVIQARRLPGSAIKPLIYAAAFDHGFTPASVILDTPLIYRDQNEEGDVREWKPKNYGNKFYGPTPLRVALTHSYNIITVKLLDSIGLRYTAAYLKKLGIESPLNLDLTMALGSNAVTPLELATAYAVFASGGVKTAPTYITKVCDRNGRVLESVDPADFPNGLASDQRLIRLKRQRVISEETAYLITNVLESVVQQGTGWRAKALNRPVAGKTGTTNNLKDAWFIGYTPQLVAASWVGYDQERPLGKKETGSRAAAPAWVKFMDNVCADWPKQNFTVPDRIQFLPVDPKTGLLEAEDNSEAVIEVFAPGTAPTRYASDEKTFRARDFFRLN